MAGKRKQTASPTDMANKRTKCICQNCHTPISERRDTSVKCALCSEWVHLRCTTLKSSDLADKNKLASLKCSLCSQTEGYVSDGENMSTDAANDETSGSNASQSALHQILFHVKELRRSMNVLQNENKELKARLVQLEENNNKLIAGLAKLHSNNRSRSRRRERSVSRVRIAKGIEKSSIPGRRRTASRSRERNEPRRLSQHTSQKANARPNNLIKRVDRRSNGAAVTQTADTHTARLPSVKARINTRRLHISKICPSVSTQALYDHLKTHGDVHPICVKRLRSRGEVGRFYVEILDIDYENAIRDDLWEDGTEISLYRGILRNDLVVETFPSP